MSTRPDWARDGRDWPNAAASRFVKAGELTWHVQIMGQGPVLLLLHGTGAATHSWRDLMPLLAGRFTVIAPDLPGHGFTQGVLRDGPTLPNVARAVGELMGALESPSPSGVSGRSVPRTELKLPGAVSPETGLGWGVSAQENLDGFVSLQAPPPTQSGVNDPPDRSGSAGGRADPELLKGRGLSPALIAGHSAGAAIGLRMVLDGLVAPGAVVALSPALLPFPGLAAQLFPTLAKMLFLNPFAPHIFAQMAGPTREVSRFLAKSTGSAIDAAGVEFYGRLFRKAGHIRGTISMMASWDLEPLKRDLPRLTLPVHVLHGERDAAIPLAKAREAAALIPGAVFGRLERLGHLAHEEAPERVAGLIADVARPT